ncbi:MAG TPA: N-(5'-phosphoribosyl)anthranilate isomerase [Lachnospiraceae bacterium]|nr:N-(5'-phosphoribosyl)anthranilate isomerase [Lachnospiraceae bacterium]
MPMQIKICGLKRPEDVAYVNAAMPEYAGFVFAGTKRRITPEYARQLKGQMNPDIQTVGVFVNEEISTIVQLVKEDTINIVQLHGDEDLAYIDRLQDALGAHKVPVIRAIRVQNQEQIKEAEKLPVDYLLLDAFHADEYGGSGKVFDHNLIPPLTKPYLLAGGIDCNNVIEILQILEEKNNLPVAVDVSSSVETDGVKDAVKIDELVHLVHSIYNR